MVARTVDAAVGEGTVVRMSIVDCATLLRYTAAGRCADGDVFRVGPKSEGLVRGGQTVTLLGERYIGPGSPGDRWTVPGEIRQLDIPDGFSNLSGTLVVTPGALRGVTLPNPTADAIVPVDTGQPDVVDNVRNAVAVYGWRVAVYSTVTQALALEQVRERRRPLAALAAAGVPTGTLARSLLWQNMIPVLVGVAVAVLTGLGLAALVFRLAGEPFSVDWPSVGLFSGTAAVLVLLVTALTLPTLRSATRLAALRSE
jgi:hypothetical protein